MKNTAIRFIVFWSIFNQIFLLIAYYKSWALNVVFISNAIFIIFWLMAALYIDKNNITEGDQNE